MSDVDDRVMRSTYLTKDMDKELIAISKMLGVSTNATICRAVEQFLGSVKNLDTDEELTAPDMDRTNTHHVPFDYNAQAIAANIESIIASAVEDYPCQYILMRTDMKSLLLPGKMAAQVAHAANESVTKARMHGLTWLLDSWHEGRSFGTTIVKNVGTISNLRDYIAKANGLGIFCGIIHDPEYPISDGEMTHLIPVDTCGFVFGMKSQCEFLKELPLY